MKESSNNKKTAGRCAKSYVPNGFIYEKTLLKSGFAKLGVDSGYAIVISDNPDIVENTAAEMLQKLLGNGCVGVAIVPESKSTGKKRFLLGRDSNLEAITRFCDRGEMKIRDVSAEDDGFHLKRIVNDFVVAGANPRGVLYGVYAFKDFVISGANGNLDMKKIPYYRKRGSGVHYSFNPYINLFTEDFPEEKAVCLSRFGINQLTDQGIGGCLTDFVQSDVFPFQIPPRADFQRKVKAMSSLCRKYGIDQYLFLNEPVLARVAGDLEKYPKEALGTVHRPWGSPTVDRTLCVHSQIVQEHLRNIMRKFVREYPAVKGVQFYNMDGSTWVCTPELCDRCNTVCKDSPPNEYNPWETQAKLVTLLAEAAHEENPDFDFRFWGTVHYHGQRFDKMIRAAQGYSSLLANWNASDRDVMVPDTATLDPAFIISREICEERVVPLYMIYEFNNLESVPRSLPFPFHVCDALKKFKRWGVKYLAEIYGLIPEHNPINALVMKEFQWNPELRSQEFLASLSVRQFGETAGKWMYRAWEEIEKAFDIWNDMQFGPLGGSQGMLSIGSVCAPPLPILPDIVKSYNDRLEILSSVETWRAPGYQKFKEKAFLEKMRRMNGHLAQAADHAKQAIATANARDFIGICHYKGVNGLPTCKEYAELNHAPIAIANALCRQRCNMLSAYHLLMEMETARAADDNLSVKAKEKQYLKLVREDIGVQEHFCRLLAGFAKMRPCYMRASLTEHEISDLLVNTRAKIDQLREFLKQ